MQTGLFSIGEDTAAQVASSPGPSDTLIKCIDLTDSNEAREAIINFVHLKVPQVIIKDFIILITGIITYSTFCCLTKIDDAAIGDGVMSKLKFGFE